LNAAVKGIPISTQAAHCLIEIVTIEHGQAHFDGADAIRSGALDS
jgi:hypothetical protein